MAKSSLFEQIEKCSTIDELSKLADVETLKKAYKSYLKSKAAHSAYNARKTKLYKLALEAGLDK